MSLPLLKKKVSLLVLALGSPLKVGIYDEGKLVFNYCDERPTSDALPLIIGEIVENYDIDQIGYARGPGSFMAIKVAYVALSTLCLIKKIPLLGADGFMFNTSTPIKAIGKKFFVKNGENIDLQDASLCEDPQPFKLPLLWNQAIFSSINEPLYVLPAL